MSRRPDDAPDEELLDPELEHALGEALRAAWAPGELDPALNRLLIEAALEDPLAAPTEEEIAESQRLRRALEGQGEHPEADLARALSAATRPQQLEPAVAERLKSSALAHRRKNNVIFVVFGAAATVAAAAAVALLVVFPAVRHPEPKSGAAPTGEQLLLSRSTDSLFDHKFDTADTTARIDRIASARARDLRSNLYTMWGVR